VIDYWHSVTLDKDKCKGCTNCIKGCPTEAIRVRDGKAQIIPERCIDCGACILNCPYHAKVAITDSLDMLSKFKHKIALPAPALYGQFKNLDDVDKITGGLKFMGFNGVYDVARGAVVVSNLIRSKLNTKNYKRPLISSACPAIVRLIQISFPELIPNIVNIESPMEIAGHLAKAEYIKNNPDALESEIGVFFITPCAAKVTAIRNPITKEKSFIDCAVSIVNIYGAIANNMKKTEANDKEFLNIQQQVTLFGLDWANSGGESNSLSIDSFLAVDGVQNVIKVLEEIENNKFTDLEFFEGLACTGGCVGGPLVFENSYVAKNRIKRMFDRSRELRTNRKIVDNFYDANEVSKICYFEREIQAKSVLRLDDDISEAIKKAEMIEKIHSELPGLDCGSCGSPNCKTLAEDIVRGVATQFDCVFKLREKVKKLAQELVSLSEKIPGGEKDGNIGIS